MFNKILFTLLGVFFVGTLYATIEENAQTIQKIQQTIDRIKNQINKNKISSQVKQDTQKNNERQETRVRSNLEPNPKRLPTQSTTLPAQSTTLPAQPTQNRL